MRATLKAGRKAPNPKFLVGCSTSGLKFDSAMNRYQNSAENMAETVAQARATASSSDTRITTHVCDVSDGVAMDLFRDEVMEQQAEYRHRGGRFIVPVPWPEVV